MAKTLMLSFTPALPCVMYQCESKATSGQVNIDRDGITLAPACPLHGYAFECDEAERKASIERFVVWMYENKGAARLIDSCSVERIPGYEPIENSHYTDEGWIVEYTDMRGQARRLYVSWIVEFLTFELYEETR